MAVTLPCDVLGQYRRFSLFNSPYAAHDDGSAIDLYPAADATSVPTPVAGEVFDVRTVRAPPKPYAPEHDHLVLVDTGDHVARLMHVDPDVSVGDRLAVGDPLGSPVRAGFFAPWVPNHVHLELRPHGVDPYRASGSLPLAVDVAVEPLAWDGTGTVAEAGDTWARLDTPADPTPAGAFAGLDGGGGVLDGGFPHYDGGGLLKTGEGGSEGPEVATLAGERIGRVAGKRTAGRQVAWDDVTVLANGDPVTGIACSPARDGAGVKLVGEEVSLAVGERVTVEIRRR